MKLDLSGITVLTEVATGPFVLTPLIAAAAGADVIAVTRDSRYGAATEVCSYAQSLASRFGVAGRIQFATDDPRVFASKSDIVTNLGFVRPIDRQFVSNLKAKSAICLMWAPWEFRAADIDREACDDYEVPIIGTNEEHQDIRTYEFLGLLAIKLLMERQIEILGAKIAVVGSDPFGIYIQGALARLGAIVLIIDPSSAQNSCALDDDLAELDAIILAENRVQESLIGEHGWIDEKAILKHGIEVINICGVVELTSGALSMHPPVKVPFGMMTVTTDYLGVKPVIDLHCGGLKAGEIVVRALRAGHGAAAAVEAAEAAGFGLAMQGR
jgi:hypothetical protein